MNPKRQRSVSATPNGMELLREAQGNSEEGRLSQSAVAERAKVSEKTVGRFFQGKSVDWSSALAIIKCLGLSKEDVLFLEDSLIEESIEKIESSDAGKSESAQQVITGLETALNQLNQDKETDFQAMDWLKANRKSLAQEAAEAVLRKNSGQAVTGTITDESDLNQFSQDIRKYLQVLYYCLEVGSWEFIDRAIQESLIPINREIEYYIEALTFIKNQKVSQDLSPKVAQTMTLLLDYLIKILPLRF